MMYEYLKDIRIYLACINIIVRLTVHFKTYSRTGSAIIFVTLRPKTYKRKRIALHLYCILNSGT